MSHELRKRTFQVRSAVMVLGLTVLALMPARGASASMLQITPIGPTVLLPGQSVTVSVTFTSTENFLLQATDLAVSYDNTRFSVSNVMLGSLDSAASGFSQSVGFPSGGVGIGEVTTSAFTGTVGNQITAGTIGTLETFTLTALSNAPVGGSTGNVNLQAQFGNTFTAVYADANGNPITLTPAPTNGFDATVDATVLIGPSTSTPEPSSLILMGLGGGLVTLTTLLRKKAGRRLAV